MPHEGSTFFVGKLSCGTTVKIGKKSKTILYYSFKFIAESQMEYEAMMQSTRDYAKRGLRV